MKPVIHIVGGGIAGLSAALAACERGANVVIYEASPYVGGRCRPLISDDFPHGQGAHLILSGDTHVLALLERIGARQRWIEIERDGLPIYDSGSSLFRRVGLSPWSWFNKRLRPEGLTTAALLQLLHLIVHRKDRPVLEFANGNPFLQTFIGPVSEVLLNTPPQRASSRKLAHVLQRFLRPGAAHLLVANEGIAADLVMPIFSRLRQFKAPLRTAMRLTAIEEYDRQAIALIFGRKRLLLESGDQVILALPSREIGRLFPGLNVPLTFEPILNAHFTHPGPETPRFFTIPSPTMHWVVARKTHVSVTVPAAEAIIDDNADDLGRRLWRNVAPALCTLGYPVDPEHKPAVQVVKERRATIRQDRAKPLATQTMPLANVTLAGDWLEQNSTTIESAVRSGETAALLSIRSTTALDPATFMGAIPHL